MIRALIVLPTSMILMIGIVVFRMGGNVPIDFVDREFVIPQHRFSDWRFYNHREWAAFSHKLNEMRDYQNAEQAAKKAIKQNPANTTALLTLFSANYYTGRLDQARYYYDRHAELYPAQHKEMFEAPKK